MKPFVSCLAVAILVAGPATAQVESYTSKTRDGVVTTTERLKAGKEIEKITCKQFNALDESFKPQAIAYAVEYTKRGKVKDPMIDVAGTEKVTPIVIRDCKTRTSEPLMTRIKAAFHHKR